MSSPRGQDPKQDEIARLLRALPPIEPPPETVARTEAAIARARARGAGATRRRRVVAGIGLMAAGILAAVGLTELGRRLDDRDAVDERSTALVLDPASAGPRPENAERFHLGAAPAGTETASAGKDDDDDARIRGVIVTEQGQTKPVDALNRLDATVTVDGKAVQVAQDKVLEDGRFQIVLEQSGHRQAHEVVIAESGDVPLVFEANLLDSSGEGEATEDEPSEDFYWQAAKRGRDGDLSFLSARGYFANTYVPGDAEIAGLRRSLAGGLYRGSERLALDELAAAPRLPFEAPRDEALAVHVAGDRDAIAAPTRMTLMVGLVGAERAPVSSAAGRAVARAVRLRIALAPGVKLVSVLGSHPLDATEIAAVRDEERADDLEIERASGIRSDRGADEDGIQIVIPAFMAGDDHAILLDVVVPGPGPVLDVRVRFKDLVGMDNGEAQASLELARGEATPTPLTLAVVERRAAFDVGEALREAAARIAEGDTAAASERVRRAAAALEQVARAHPGARLEADRRLLAAYAQLLASAAGWMGEPALERYVKDSMSLSGALRSGSR